MSPVEVPLSELKLSDDIPQFKAGADKSTGVVTPLQGKFDRVGVTPIMVWERLDGSKEIITGRHRFELAQRSGEDTIPSYVVKESEGYTLANALQADAILNIRDNQGEVSDYARYFRDSGISKEEAQSEGALRLAKGQQGFDIASNSGELLFRYHQAGQLTDKQAAAIANAAPGNEQLQTLGIDQINNGRSIDVAVGTMQAVQAMQAIEGQAAESGDMFGFDDAAMKQAEKIARRVAAKKREIRERISAAKGAATRPDKAKEMGIDVKDPEGIKAKIKELQAESERLDSWTTNPELRAELIGDDAFTLTTKPAEQAQEDEAPAQQDDRTGNKAQSPKRFEQTLDDDFGPGKANQDMSASGIKRAADRASGKNYALETQTEESLAAEAKKQEEAKAQAAAQEQRDKQSPDDFVLTGSTSPVDEAEARGQTNLADLIGKNDERKEAVAKNINDESTPTIFTNDAGTLFYTVTRAPNGDKKYQVTVWDKDGPMSDSKHNTADEIIRHYGYGNEFKKDATQAEFDAYVGKANDAKAQVTAQEETPAESSSALPDEFDFEGEISTKQDVSIDDLIAKSGQKQAETAPDQAETDVPRGTLDIDQRNDWELTKQEYVDREIQRLIAEGFDWVNEDAEIKADQSSMFVDEWRRVVMDSPRDADVPLAVYDDLSPEQQRLLQKFNPKVQAAIEARLREEGAPIREAMARKKAARSVSEKEKWERTWAEQRGVENEGMSRRLTKAEWADARKDHRQAVVDAQKNGKTIPDAVLKDYPELAPKKSELQELNESIKTLTATLKGQTAPQAAVTEYPLADRGEWYADADYEARGARMVNMTPDEYLAQVRPLTIDEESRENIDLLKAHMQEGKTLDPVAIYPDGSEDGRHRAHAAKELGIEQIPVLDFRKQNLDDFGEKLGGSRADKAQMQIASAISEMDDAEIASKTLSQLWPKASIDKIESAFPAAFAHAARAEIPNKPRVKYKLDRWVKQVKMLTSFMRFVEELTERDQISRLLEKMSATRGLEGFKNKVELLQELDRKHWDRVGDVRTYPDAMRYTDEKDESGKTIKIPAPQTYIRVDGRGHTFYSANWRDHIPAIKKLLGETEEESSRIAFEIRGTKSKGYNIYKKGDSEYRVVAGPFTEIAEVRRYLNEQYDDVVKAWDAIKARDNVSKTDVRNAENKPRTGKDYRNGRDVRPEEFGEAFGFRGTEFGKWVGQGKGAKERQGLLNQAYDALMDLADIIGIPPKAISLNGELGLAFGSRGKGSASAHFEPDYLVINLTKTKGAGTFAHEWFHALDNYFQRKREITPVSRETRYITYAPEPMMVHKMGRDRMTKAELERRRGQHPDAGFFKEENWHVDANHPEGVRPEVERVFSDLVQRLDESPMRQRAAIIDKGKENGYWSRIIERAARSFENYIVSKMALDGYDNEYLANVKSWEEWKAQGKNADRYPYLEPDEIAPIAEAFDALFDVIETKETEKGVALFSRVGQRGYTYDGKESSLQGGGRIESSVPDIADGFAQGDLFIDESASGEEKAQQLKDHFATTTANRKIGELKTGTTQIKDEQDLAHLVASIRKKAQERFIVVVTDKDDNILMVSQHTTGLKDSSSVDPLTVVAQAAGIEGAANIHYAHNHPSGIAEPSGADRRITDTLERALDGTGIAQGMHVVVGDNGQAVEFAKSYENKFAITPRLRDKTVPIVERTLVKRGKLSSNISSPETAATAISAIDGDNVILLLDAQYAITGVVRLSVKEMSALREGGAVNRILSAIDKTNAAATIIKTTDKDAAANVSRMINEKGGRVLDVFAPDSSGSLESDASIGGTIAESRGAFFSQRNGWQTVGSDQNRGTSTVEQVRAAIKQALDKLNQEEGFGIEVVADMSSLPYGIRSQADPWSRYKGVYYKGKVYLIASSIGSARDARMTLAHELVGHKGVLEMASPEEWADIKKTIQGLIDRGSSTAKSISEEVDARYGRIDTETFYKEFLAVAMERRVNTGSVGKLVAKMKEIVRRFLKLYGLNTFSSSEIDIILSNAESYLKAAGEFSRLGGRTSFSQNTPGTFYSSLRMAAEKLMQDKGTPDQMLGAMRKIGGVKEEELEWTGLTDYLKGVGKTVTKQQIIDYLDANGVRVTPIVLGGSDDISNIAEKYGYEVDQDMGGESQFIDDEGEYTDFYDLPEEMRTELGNTNYMEPSYGDYVTPGGTNYREVLLTLPESTEKNIKVVPHPTKEGFAIQRADGSFVSVEDTLAHAMGSAYQDEGNNVPAQWETEYMAREYGLPAHDKDAYRGGHYGSDFPNVIAHIRMNDRVVPVHTEASIEDIERRIMQAVPAAKSGSSLGSGAPEMAVRKGLITEAEAGKYSHYRGYRNEDQFNQTEKVLFIEEIQSDWHQSGKKHGYKKGDVNSVPDAPFKGNAWVDLAVKQIYRIAAEGGYDRVAWTTGEQQADRYDLSRQIDSIAYIEKDGRYTFDAIKGNSVPFFKRGITIQEVEAALGKEIAQKMEQGIGITDGDYGPDWKELSGVDLKVGGEGMKSFYDKTLRNTFSTIGKKLDKNARVSPVAILTGEKYTVISDRPSFHSVHHQDGRFIKNYSTREEAERVARELPELVQMGVNITPAMRDSAMAGQSLFSKAKAEGYKGSDELLASRSPLSAFQPPSNRGASGSLPQILSGVEDRLDSFRFQVQDKLIDLKRAQDSIRASGANIDDSANAYRKAAIWEGKTGERLNDFDELSVQPLVARMADTGLDIATIGEWLVARHANEANTYLAEINPDKPDAERYRLAGMSSGLNPADPTDNEAAAILDRHSGNVALQDVGGMIDDINDHRVMMLVRDGLLTPQMASAWQGRYRHYVPLKREEADSLDLLPSRGQGFSLTGKESKMRTGSAYWTPAHIVTNTLAQMEASIVRAGKNDVDKALLELVEANPNPGFWEVDYDRVQKSVRGGKVVEGNKAFDSPNELTVKKGGRDVVISFSPTNTKAMRLVTGMKNLSASDMGGIMRAMATVTRFLAQVNTSWNPEFIISNFFRDIQTAGYNLTSTELADAKKAVLKNTFSAINGIRSALFGDGSADWAPIWEDFRKHGGKTGWIDLHNDIKVRERNLQKTIDRMRAGGDYKGKMTKLLESVDDMNVVIENGVRLSAYKNALDRFITPGMTQQEIDGAKDRAAALAKDLTVNFNRKGNWGPVMNALYMFANASIQGSARLLQAMVKSKEGRKLAIATVGFAIFLDIVNRSLSGDDDDGENIYDNLPDYIKDHNLIFMGDKEPIVKIPLPWGYNVLHTIGQVIGESISSGRFNASESASRLASSAIDAFNPVGSGTLLQVISPTITDPLAMISENKTFMGTDLKPEHTFDKTAPVPEYQMHWSSARETSKFVAKWLNDNTGGNEVRPGDINVSPEWLELIWDTATGGLGRTVGNSTDVLARVIQGKPVPTKNIPFVRKVTGYDSQYGVKTRYYEWAKNAAYAKEELLTLKGKDLEDARKRPIAKIVPLYMGTEKTLKALRSARKGMVAAGADQERIDQIDERIRDVMANFNMQYAKKILD